MRSSPSIPYNCDECGAEFLTWPYKLRDRARLFCSNSCSNRQPRASLETRLWAKIAMGDPQQCWPFTGATNQYGYGIIQRGGRDVGTALAHRLAWESFNGPIPGGAILLHSCDNPPCCNPSHLTPGTYSENLTAAYARLQRRKPSRQQ